MSFALRNMWSLLSFVWVLRLGGVHGDTFGLCSGIDHEATDCKLVVEVVADSTHVASSWNAKLSEELSGLSFIGPNHDLGTWHAGYQDFSSEMIVHGCPGNYMTPCPEKGAGLDDWLLPYSDVDVYIVCLSFHSKMSKQPVRASKDTKELLDEILQHGEDPFILLCEAAEGDDNSTSVEKYNDAMLSIVNDYQGQHVQIQLVSKEEFLHTSPDVVLEIDNTLAMLSSTPRALLPASKSTLSAQGFVQVSGTRFVLDNKPLLFTGSNCYYLMERAAAGEKDKVDDVLEDMIHKGEFVMRTWAFADGTQNWQALQPYPGKFNEHVFRGLDYVLYKASSVGVKLILTFVNEWDEYGGKAKYVQWSNTASSKNDFFSDGNCKRMYRDFVTKVITRVNTYSGLAYKDDPVIFSWELINEPRLEGDASGAVLKTWITEMAAHVKALDSKHLLTVGLEGFYKAGTKSAHLSANPGAWAGRMGSDFIEHHALPGIDFATSHVYPHHFLGDHAPWSQMMEYYERAIRAHHADGDVLNMPVVLAEFSIPNNQRSKLFAKAYELIYASASSGGAAAGGMYWVAMAHGGSNSGGWDVYYPGSHDVIPLIQKHAADMRSLMAKEAANVVVPTSNTGTPTVEIAQKATPTSTDDSCGIAGGVSGYGETFVGVRANECECQRACIDAGRSACDAWSFCSTSQCGDEYHHCWMKQVYDGGDERYELQKPQWSSGIIEDMEHETSPDVKSTEPVLEEVDEVPTAVVAPSSCGRTGGVSGFDDVLAGKTDSECACQQACMDAGRSKCQAWSFCSTSACGDSRNNCWMKMVNEGGDERFSPHMTQWTSGIISETTTVMYSDQLGVNSVLDAVSVQLATHCGAYSGGGQSTSTTTVEPSAEWEDSVVLLEVQQLNGNKWATVSEEVASQGRPATLTATISGSKVYRWVATLLKGQKVGLNFQMDSPAYSAAASSLEEQCLM